MKLRAVFTILFFSIFHFGFTQTKTPQDKPTIAILGTFHFAGSSSDAASLKVDDIKTEKRQKEILELVDNLVKYKPTKILLEYPYSNTRLDSLFNLYLTDKHNLYIGESQQLGFRIAKMMQHKHIYPADFKMDLPFEDLMGYLEKEGKTDQFQNMMGHLTTLMTEMQTAYDSNTLNDFLVYMNNDKNDALNKNLYLEYINKMGSETNTIGPDVVATWWHRNFKIMRNIDAIAEPNDRILVIFGQGHTSIFKDFYKTRDDYVFEDIINYLKSENNQNK